MLFDRNPRWTLFSDKWLVRQFIQERIGTEYLIPVLWHGTKPEDIPFALLPTRFVIKATHGCGYNIFVQDKNLLDRSETIHKLIGWLAQNYGTDVFPGVQWGYKDITPSIIIEEFLGEGGLVPYDYKIYCFSGRVHYIEIHTGRFGAHATAVMDRDFNPVDLSIGPFPHHDGVERPDNFKDLIRIAEALAEGLDFIRVDLYAVKGRSYFGELTCYHGGGCVPFNSKKDDFFVGKQWQVKASRRSPRC